MTTLPQIIAEIERMKAASDKAAGDPNIDDAGITYHEGEENVLVAVLSLLKGVEDDNIRVVAELVEGLNWTKGTLKDVLASKVVKDADEVIMNADNLAKKHQFALYFSAVSDIYARQFAKHPFERYRDFLKAQHSQIQMMFVEGLSSDVAFEKLEDIRMQQRFDKMEVYSICKSTKETLTLEDWLSEVGFRLIEAKGEFVFPKDDKGTTFKTLYEAGTTVLDAARATHHKWAARG